MFSKSLSSILFLLFFLFLDPNDNFRLTDKLRPLGLVVCRGTGIILISPVEGTEEIANPFLQQGEES